MVTPAELSVVIPARDAAATIGEQLDALTSQRWSGGFEVIVVDNRSRDATAEIVRAIARVHPFVRLEAAPARDGPGYARNVGARAATGILLAFCDADDVVGDGWVAAMGDALRGHDFVTGPLELDRLNPPWLAGSRGRHFAQQAGLFEGIFPFASSCNMGIRRALFTNSGGFDESPLMAVGEDLDFSFRLWLAGVGLHFEPRATIHYRYRSTLGGVYRQARDFGRSRPVIAERIRMAGHRAPARSAGLRNWVWLARHMPMLKCDAGRARWLWVAGTRIGTLEGSLRQRRLYL